jgi:hypothetical protein
VLAPAFGDGGRSLFAAWAARLLGSVTSKLIYSFLFGALLTMQRMLGSLQSLGWWTDWLLLGAFWWGAFLKRHQALAFVHERGRAPVSVRGQSIVRRVGAALETPRAMVGAARWARDRALSHAPGPEQPRKRARPAPEHKTLPERTREQVLRTLEHDHGDANVRVRARPQIEERIATRTAQLERVRRARQIALTTGQERRAAKLAVRRARIETELAAQQQSLGHARRTVADGSHTRDGVGFTRRQIERRARFLDEQAALPASAERRRGSPRRDYQALAGLAGHRREQYEQLDPRPRREARLRIDRELALRSQLHAASRELVNGRAPEPRRRERREPEIELDHALERRLRANATPPPSAPSAHDSRRPPPVRTPTPKSTVIDDAREVAARRKRQLGHPPTP